MLFPLGPVGKLGIRPASILLIVMAVTPAACWSERILLRSGKELTGRIEAENAGQVTVQTSSGRVSLARTAIASIERQSESETILSQLEDAGRRKDLRAAVAAIRRLPRDPALRLAADKILERYSGELSAAAAVDVMDLAGLRSYISIRETTASAELQLMLAALLVQSGDPQAAQTLIQPIPHHTVSRSPVRELLLKRIRNQLVLAVANEPSEQEASYLELLSHLAPDQVSSSTTVVVKLREAELLRQDKRYADAISVLVSAVRPTAPATAWDHAMKILAEAEQATTTSVFVELCGVIEKEFRDLMVAKDLVPVYQQLVRGLTALGRFDDARLAAARLSMTDAESGAIMEHRVELAERRSRLPNGDLLGRYRLGAWAREAGLHDEAVLLLRGVLSDPELRENARLQLTLLETERQRGEFRSACLLLERKQFAEAGQALGEFVSKYPHGDLTKRARELWETAKFQAWSAQQRKPAEAEIARQNAERHFLQADYDKALALLDRIEVDYSGTEAAGKAHKMRDQIHARTGKSLPKRASSSSSLNPTEARRLAEIRAMALHLAAEQQTAH